MGGDVVSAAMAGLLLGVQFNPLASVVGASLAAAFATAGRTGWALAVLFAAWLVGDGARVIARGTDALAGSTLIEGGAAAARRSVSGTLAPC